MVSLGRAIIRTMSIMKRMLHSVMGIKRHYLHLNVIRSCLDPDGDHKCYLGRRCGILFNFSLESTLYYNQDLARF